MIACISRARARCPGWLPWAAPAGLAAWYFLRYRSPVYAAVALALFAAHAFPWRLRPRDLGRALASLCAAAAAAAAAIAAWRYRNLGDAGDVDMACYTQAFRQLARGRLFVSVYDARYFSGHSNYLSALFVPAFLAGGNYALIACQAACLGSAAWISTRPLRASGPAAAAILAAIFLSPPWAANLFFGFHADAIGAPILALAAWAFHRRRLAAYLVLAALAGLAKETMTLGVAGLCLLALAERRDARWWAWPAALCAAEMGLYWYVLAPALAGGTGNYYHAYLPASPRAWVALWFRPGSLAYLFGLLAPFTPLFLVLGPRHLLPVLPAALFYLGFPDPSYRDLWRHYGLVAGAMAWGGLWALPAEALAPPRLARLATPLLSAMVLSYPAWRADLAGGWRPNPRARDLAQAQALVPPGATVLAHGPFIAHLADRDILYNWIYARGNGPDTADLGACGARRARIDAILVDGTFRPAWMGRERGRDLDADLGRWRGSSAWVMAYARDSLYLFLRR